MLVLELDREAAELLERAGVVGLLPRVLQPELDRWAVAFGEMFEHVALFVAHAALERDLVAEHLPDRLAQGFGAVDHEQQPLLDIQAAGDQVRQQRGGDGGVLGAARPQAERELVALGRDPERDDIGAALDLDPVEHHHREAQVSQLAGHQMPQRLPRALDERPRNRRLRRRALPPGGLLADRLLAATVLAGRDTGQHPLQRQAAELVAIGEMLIGPQWHLRLAIRRAHSRTLDRNAPTAERHLPVLVTVTNRSAARVVLALRADDLIDLLLEQLPKHAEPHPHRQRQQPLPRSPTNCPNASCTRSGSTASSVIASATGTLHFTAVPPSILADRPSRSHQERTSREGPPSPQSSTSPGTTSSRRRRHRDCRSRRNGAVRARCLAWLLHRRTDSHIWRADRRR